MSGRERRIIAAREQMLNALLAGGADPEVLEIIERPAPSQGRIRDLWARFSGRDVELIARKAVR